MTITRDLVDMALGADDLPEDALDVMRLSILDWAACAIAGAAEPVARAVRAVEFDNGGRATASVVAEQRRLPMRGAAMVNGVAAHALDFDDTHFAHIGHPSAVIVAATLAMAEHQGDAVGDRFLRAALRGAEASVRVGVWLGRSHYEAGFHQTATAGAIGAAVAGAAVFQLQADQTRSAIGLAATRAAGLKVQFGTMGKPYHAGMAAAAGVEAVHAAMMGLVGADEVLGGPFGFAATHHGAGDMQAFAQPGLLFPSVSHKYHACCHGTHAGIEAALLLKDQVALHRIDSIDVAVHPRWLDVCAIPAPQTRLEAKFSLSATVAMALTGHGLVSPLAFESEIILSPEVVALRDSVQVCGDASLSDMEAHVAIRSGSDEFTAHHDLAEVAAFELRAARVLEKAAALVGRDRADELWGAINRGKGVELEAFSAALRGV